MVDAHFWLALNALLFTHLTYRLMEITPNWPLMLMIFFATLGIYNLQSYPSVAYFGLTAEKPTPLWKIWAHNLIFWTSAITVLLLLLDFRMDKNIYLLHLAIISLLYAFPSSRPWLLLPLRSLPFTKIFLLLYVWVSATVIFPVWDRVSDGHLFFLITAERSFFIFSLGLAFDIRDRSHDLAKKLKTIANQAGIYHTKVLSLFSLSTAALLAFMLYRPETATAILLSYIATSVLIFQANEEKNEYYYTGLLDSSMALQWLLVMAIDGAF